MQDMTEPAWLGKLPKIPWGGVAQKFVGGVHLKKQNKLHCTTTQKTNFLTSFYLKEAAKTYLEKYEK